jgi:hypothetical protein
MSPPRIQPKEPPYAPELAEMLAKWMPPGAGIDPLKLFRTLGHNLPLAEAMRGVGSYMLGKRLSVSMKERELIIDRFGLALERSVSALSAAPTPRAAGVGWLVSHHRVRM